MPRNQSWHRDELILALDLCFREDFGRLRPSHPEVVKLSNVLNALEMGGIPPDKERFRNGNGVYMKLGNFRALDSRYAGVGLGHVSKLDREVWSEFEGRQDDLRSAAAAIARGSRR